MLPYESAKGGGLGLGRWKLWWGSSMDLGTRLEADWVVGLGEVPDAGPAVVCLLPPKGRLQGRPTPPFRAYLAAAVGLDVM